jgi:hypothetical protein
MYNCRSNKRALSITRHGLHHHHRCYRITLPSITGALARHFFLKIFYFVR